MTSYVVDAERSGQWWVLQCREHPGAITQVRRLDQAHQIIEAIAFVASVPSESVSISIEPRLPDDVASLVASTRTLRSQAKELEANVSRDMRRSARGLLAHGLSQRDAAVILGVSYQRVHQLVNEPAVSEPAVSAR